MVDGRMTAPQRFVGAPVLRKEDPRLLRGQGRYVDDLKIATLHVAFVRSTVAAGRIVSIDATEARALPGVHAVYTAADLCPGELTRVPYSCGFASSLEPKASFLAHDEVRYVGDPIAVVIADDRYIAEDGAELVEVDYDPIDAVVDHMEAEGMRSVHPDLGTNLAYSADPADIAELEAIFAAAPIVVEHIIDQQRHSISPMETRGMIVVPGPELTIHASIQNPQFLRAYIAKVFAIPEAEIRVACGDVGGAFGMKFFLHRDELAVIAAARRFGRAIRWIEDRVENLSASHARREWGRARMALSTEGDILATHLDYRADCGAYPLIPPEHNAANVTLMFQGPYRIARSGVSARMTFTNTPPLVAYRGPWMFETLAREALIDAAAARLGVDPVEFRRRHIIGLAEQPFPYASGAVLTGVTPAEALDMAIEKLGGLDAFREMQARARADGRHIGLGTSVYVEPTSFAFLDFATEAADIRIEPSGRVQVTVTLSSQGHSIETTMAQIVADELGVELDDVEIRLGDTAFTGWGIGASGSRQAVIGGGAVKRAAEAIRGQIFDIAAHLLQTQPEMLSARGGLIETRGDGGASISLSEVARTAYFGTESLPEHINPGLQAHSRYRPAPITFSNAAHFCVCEVDIDTGLVQILRWIGVEDCGVMLNPAVVEGQIAGGVAQGISGVLFENAIYDEYGNPQAGTYKDYLLPLITDMPEIEFGHLCTPSDTPTGARGVGEGGAIVAPAAVVNAIADALTPFAVRSAILPLSPDRLLELLSAAPPTGVLPPSH